MTPTSSINGLPPSLQVPPFPPQIHRRLRLAVKEDGLLLSPDSGDSVLVRWGVRGKLETTTDDADGVAVGGVLGIVRLWDGE